MILNHLRTADNSMSNFLRFPSCFTKLLKLILRLLSQELQSLKLYQFGIPCLSASAIPIYLSKALSSCTYKTYNLSFPILLVG